MVDKPKDNKPAMEHGEVKVIKNEPPPGGVDPGKTPGSAEAGVQQGEPTGDPAGKTPGSAESGK
jgi:hypothetical protein